MGAKKEKGNLIKCRCPRCKKDFEMHLFLFNHNPNRIYHKYCQDCKNYTDRISTDYDVGDGCARSKTGIKNEA